MTLDTLWVLVCTGLVFLMQAGFMCLESGMTRSKNSINVAVKNLSDFGVSVGLYWLFGYGLMFGLSASGWWGTTQFLPAFNTDPQLAVFFLFQAMFCGTSTTIISGATAERLKFSAYLVIAGWVSGFIYPTFGHWAWNETGWLQQLGFLDFAGSTVVHSIGAWVGLAAIATIGPRKSRFSPEGKSLKIQGSNMPFSVLGALILWFGWIGFNGGSTLAFDDRVPGIIANTMLGGVSGTIVSAILSLVRYQFVEVEQLVNGSLAGLVAVTACASVLDTPMAAIVGGTGAAIATLASEGLKYWKIDDAVDAFAVHGAAGIWGTLCVGLFGNLAAIDTGLSRGIQILAQLLGIVTAFAWAFGLSWGVLKLVDRVFPLRISPREEELGLNISEHHAKTETYDLFRVMDYQAKTHDLSLRVPVEPFTEVGHIATRYNQVMDSFEARHRQSVDDLAQIYYVTAAVTAAIEHNTFKAENLGLEEMAQRGDEFGSLARVIQEMVEIVQQRDRDLLQTRQAAILAVLESRFGEVPEKIRDRAAKIETREQFQQWLTRAIALENIDEVISVTSDQSLSLKEET